MVTVLGIWEVDWMEAERTERRVWKQTIQAFGVDTWGMCDVHGGPFTSPIQYADLATMLAAHPGPKTFLIKPDTVPEDFLVTPQSLEDYIHPDDAIYVFGNSHENLLGYVTDSDAVVSIYTPAPAAMFGHAVVGIVLYDRHAKAP